MSPQPWKKRQEGLPKAVTDIAWEAQRRLHHRYVHLTRTGKKQCSRVAVTAVARELAGFVLEAIARQIQPRQAKSLNLLTAGKPKPLRKEKNDIKPANLIL